VAYSFSYNEFNQAITSVLSPGKKESAADEHRSTPIEASLLSSICVDRRPICFFHRPGFTFLLCVASCLLTQFALSGS
jgi:hypothetical protein